MPNLCISASLLAATALLGGCVTPPADGDAATAGLDRSEASIPFADQRATIREWQADGNAGIWVQDAHRNWYYGRFHTHCFGLDFANAVGFQTGSTGRLDRFATIVVPGEDRCPLRSFTASEAPPDNGNRRDGAAPATPSGPAAAEPAGA